MEVQGGHKNKGWVCLFEAIGTLFLVIAFNWGSNSPTAMACTLFVGIMLFGNMTGGHFNPAVTLSVLISGGEIRKDILFALLIMISQIIGAFFGILIARGGLPFLLSDAPIDSN